MAEYKTIEELGRGSFGQVMKVERNGEIMAAKIVKYARMSEKEKKLLVDEVNILRDLSHPNIVRYIDRDVNREAGKLTVFMEYCAGGDLAAYIRRHKREARPIRDDVIWSVFAQMVSALAACHTRKPTEILHRDIKPGNIMIGEGQCVKLGDFGLARELNANSYAFTNVGTPLYMSPEQIQKRPYDDKCDIWSLGCVIYELATLNPPFTATTQETLNRKILRESPLPIRGRDDELIALINTMLDKSPVRRPSAASLESNPRMAKILATINKTAPSQEAASEPSDESVADRRERELDRREAEVRRREADLERREAAVARRETEATRREQSLKTREATTAGRQFTAAAPARPTYGGLNYGYGAGRRPGLADNYRNY
ncbi:serine/threonine-protein kinase nek2 [Carpediemonas membranifera]|uniref:non-specific serine/threonine protein kinase n=1 Tax=Carpediemonas membranifera TaxID=201153 RepID=A0A8J6AQL8_9EUKA|nr:serine/threonine-protein kinase nek2 [Carpediemonas membranifera]KAG9391591.1 serine/threonine-protein kinase nek2 [Carpediemonas membranifera]|eukprot:KAG9391584.1 serine/threonine-protein kinase nek2 [Carpediemonas membranifera]